MYSISLQPPVCGDNEQRNKPTQLKTLECLDKVIVRSTYKGVDSECKINHRYFDKRLYSYKYDAKYEGREVFPAL